MGQEVVMNCPRCRAGIIVVLRREDRVIRFCAACGYSRDMTLEGNL